MQTRPHGGVGGVPPGAAVEPDDGGAGAVPDPSSWAEEGQDDPVSDPRVL